MSPISGEDQFKAAVALHQHGMSYKKYGNSLLYRAIKGTNYECILPLNATQNFTTGFIFSTEKADAKLLLKIIKKIPQFNLMCGIVEGRLLSRNEFVDYAKMDIQVARSELANTLNLAGNEIVKNLQSHQTNLVRILEAHVRERTKEENPGVDEKKEE